MRLVMLTRGGGGFSAYPNDVIPAQAGIQLTGNLPRQRLRLCPAGQGRSRDLFGQAGSRPSPGWRQGDGGSSCMFDFRTDAARPPGLQTPISALRLRAGAQQHPPRHPGAGRDPAM